MRGRLLDKTHLLEIMKFISNPKRYALTQKELEQAIENYCAGCPDPIQAYWLIAENPDPMTDEEIVDRALGMAYIHISFVPRSIVHANHPARVLTP
jgi:hypothetical protein